MSTPVNRPGYLVLCNPISNEGHLDSWHVMFIDLLVKSGWKVIAATEDPVGLQKKLDARGLSGTDRIIVAGPAAGQRATLLSSGRQRWTRWNAYCDARLFQRQWRGRGAQDGLLRNMAAYITDAAVLRLQTIIQTLHRVYAAVRRQSHTPQDRQVTTHIDPSDFRERIRQLAAQYPGQILGVLNMYVDAYMQDQAHWQQFSLAQDIPWMGLCITPSKEPCEGYYGVPSYRGTCFLDESVCAHYQAVMPQRHFEFLPDITETALPEQPSPLALEITRIAAGRKIVFMGGSIGKQKNLACWYTLMAMLDPAQWFFVQIGRINKNNLTAEDEAALDKTLSEPPPNLYIRPEYLSDERFFNEIISISDVVFAVYRDFARSSNMLSKAAYFEKPILVTKGCLMGERVSFYGIGKAVSQDDVQDMFDGLLALGHIPELKNNFYRYRQDFSEAIVQTKLSTFVQACLEA